MSLYSAQLDDSGQPLVQVRGLHVQFGRQAVLREINVEVSRGETVAVIGESGCGKTVLLKTIIGLVRPTKGSVSFEGRDLASLSPRDLAETRTRFGLVFPAGRLVR